MTETKSIRSTVCTIPLDRSPSRCATHTVGESLSGGRDCFCFRGTFLPTRGSNSPLGLLGFPRFHVSTFPPQPITVQYSYSTVRTCMNTSTVLYLYCSMIFLADLDPLMTQDFHLGSHHLSHQRAVGRTSPSMYLYFVELCTCSPVLLLDCTVPGTSMIRSTSPASVLAFLVRVQYHRHKMSVTGCWVEVGHGKRVGR